VNPRLTACNKASSTYISGDLRVFSFDIYVENNLVMREEVNHGKVDCATQTVISIKRKY
jgi:hypothetical protein